MKIILLSTHNKNKFNEFKIILKDKKINLKYLCDISKVPPKENGGSFTQNAIIKSMYAANLMEWKYDCLADDSGLCIEDLRGEPGIYSSRWAPKGNYNKAFKKIKNKFYSLGKEMNGSNAKFVCKLAYIKKDKTKFEYEGVLEGSLVYPPRGKLGFGYDSIFIPLGKDKTLAELSGKIKNQISHRKKAVDDFLMEQFSN
ncbi:MAG: non-canonical purine NTP pyrophosphatase, RdgB/HAM1 family [Rickettsiales bacterium]|nr:non-canonical purine NTP pyrophosphatase, RdgB/HAM1 family [Rickettsiales bacterium]